MTTFFLSKFETYLLDEENRLDSNDEQTLADDQGELPFQEEYPPGFFTSL